MGADLIVFLVALLASGLSFFSGFGLGTLLLPAMMVFLAPELAVAATAIVHFANNVLKVSLLWRGASRAIVLRFGIPAVLAAVAGAWLLTHIAAAGGALSYSLFGVERTVGALQMVLAGLIFVFALLELLPPLQRLTFAARYLPLGGVISGFFGGLSGHQGALRSAFLVKTGIKAEAFVATNAVIGFAVDAVRIAVYAAALLPALKAGAGTTEDGGVLILFGIAGAFLGVILGRKYLHKTTIRGLQTLVGVLLLALAIGLGAGLI